MTKFLIFSMLFLVFTSTFAFALTAPTNIDIQKLSSSGSSASVGIWWDSVDGATGYNLYESTNNQTFYLMYKNISTTTITIILPLNHTYYFKLTAINSTAESVPTPVFWINTTTGVASVPHHVPASGNGTKTYSSAITKIASFKLDKEYYNGNLTVHFNVTLTNDLRTGESIFVYKSIDAKTFSWVSLQGSASGTHWDLYDTNITSTGVYYYYARVENSTNYGNRTEIYQINMTTGTVTPLKTLLTPTLKSVQEVMHNGKPAVLIKWSVVKQALRYEVYRSTEIAGSYIKLKESYYQNGSMFEMLDTYNITNTTYYYYIVAIGYDGERSYQSNIMWVNVETGQTGFIPVAGIAWIPHITMANNKLIVAGVIILLLFLIVGGRRK